MRTSTQDRPILPFRINWTSNFKCLWQNSCWENFLVICWGFGLGCRQNFLLQGREDILGEVKINWWVSKNKSINKYLKIEFIIILLSCLFRSRTVKSYRAILSYLFMSIDYRIYRVFSQLSPYVCIVHVYTSYSVFKKTDSAL